MSAKGGGGGGGGGDMTVGLHGETDAPRRNIIFSAHSGDAMDAPSRREVAHSFSISWSQERKNRREKRPTFVVTEPTTDAPSPRPASSMQDVQHRVCPAERPRRPHTSHINPRLQLQ